MRTSSAAFYQKQATSAASRPAALRHNIKIVLETTPSQPHAVDYSERLRCPTGFRYYLRQKKVITGPSSVHSIIPEKRTMYSRLARLAVIRTVMYTGISTVHTCSFHSTHAWSAVLCFPGADEEARYEVYGCISLRQRTSLEIASGNREIRPTPSEPGAPPMS